MKLGAKLGPEMGVKLDSGEYEEGSKEAVQSVRGTLPAIEAVEEHYISIMNPKEKTTEPVLVGVPTINSDPSLKQEIVNVGAGKQIKVLNGRYYLAR
jgi:hypothetical protein